MFAYLGCCIYLDRDSVGVMVEDAIDLTSRVFRERIGEENYAKLSNHLGYSFVDEGVLTLASDWHVSFHRSQYESQPCYYCNHSAIEYVFVEIP